MTVDTQDAARVDVVIPVYGGLRHVRACLDSLSSWTRIPHHLIVVDDASDARTSATVQHLVTEGWGERGTVLVNEENLGFLRTANRGMREGSAPVIVLLNSDTLVTPGWLDGLLASLERDETIGVTSPLSNNANLTRIAVPYGSDHLEMARTLQRVSPRAYPEIQLATGFCLAARRSLFEELDFFDERYGRGYFEEADLCLRAADLGYRTIADDATYVHHHGWGSFGAEERNRLMEHNERLFHERWGEGAHRRLRRRMLRQRLFAEHERRIHVELRGSAQVAPRRSLPRSGTRNVAERARVADERPQHRSRVPTHTRYPLDDWARIAQQAPGGTGRHEDVRDMLVLVDDLSISPFTTDLLQLTDRLMQRGTRVGLASSGAFDTALFTDPCRLRPYVVTGPDEMLSVVPPHRLVIATSPNTVFDALLLRERDGCHSAAWFEPQAAGLALGWPDDGWAAAVAPWLVQAQLGPAPLFPTRDGSTPFPGVPFHPVPLGVDPEVYEARPLPERPRGVLVTYDAGAGPDATSSVTRAVDLLSEAGIEPTVYGTPLPGREVRSERLAPQTVEAPLLTDHLAVLEITPIPGLQRFRLRCAATGTPLVLASPAAATSPLRPGDDAFAAPRGDVERMVEIARGIVRDPASAADRVASARARAEAAPVDAEVEALARVVRAIDERPST